MKNRKLKKKKARQHSEQMKVNARRKAREEKERVEFEDNAVGKVH